MSELRMPEINVVVIDGRLTRDPELRYLPSGTALCKIGIANGRHYKTKDGEKKEDTTFVNATAWGKTAEYVNQYIKKGDPVLIKGSLRSFTFETKEGEKRSGNEITVEEI